MYGYKTKHKILKECENDLLENPDSKNPDFTHFIWMKEFSYKLGSNEKEAGKISRYLSIMGLDGLFDSKIDKEKKDIQFIMTEKGVNASLSNYYKIKQDDWFWKMVINTVMTLANIAVVVTAVWAITTTQGDELKKLEDRLKLIEEAHKLKPVQANPNNPQTQNCYQSNTKPDLKKSDSVSDSLTKN